MIIDEHTPVFTSATSATIGYSSPVGYNPASLLIPIEKPAKRESANNVDHPAHYKGDKYECIDVMEETYGKDAVQHFCILNAFKYLYRQNKKNGSEDVSKAIWYLNKYIELDQKGGSNE